MSPADDARMYEAILVALVRRAGGEIRLSAAQVRDAGNGYRLCIRADRRASAIALTVAPVAPVAVPGTGP